MVFDFMSQPLMATMAVGGCFFVVAAIIGSLKVFQAEVTEREHNHRLALLPAREELFVAKAELVHRKDELMSIEGQINALRVEEAELRRHAVDAQHWEALAQSTEEAYKNLGDKASAVEKVRDQYEEAAKDLAEIRSARDDLIRQRDTLQQKIGDIEAKREEAEKLIDVIEERAKEVGRLNDEIKEIEDVREERERARIALDQLATLKADFERDIESLPKKIEELEDRRDTLQNEVTDLTGKREERLDLDDLLQSLNARKEALTTDIEYLKAERDSLLGIRTSVGTNGGSGADTALSREEAEKAVEDLWTKPSCLFEGGIPILTHAQDNVSEQEALNEVANYLSELGLHFEDALIKRFHTSLKISRVSPLTVLAGISGTGKSLLPQRYAEAMGIPFLKVAVQPRWDSPQDLLGFYNYLEKKYKAADLARAMAYVDPRSNNHIEGRIDEPMDDRLLMVLMDEMNLARIEYYFSEFLSRLENRPGPDSDDTDKLRSSRIDIDVPIMDDQSISIYPGHNTLFVGTMNEDESTQALSDKVLDRGNAIRFKEPHEFTDRVEDYKAKPSNEFLSFDTWQGWFKQNLPEEKRDRLVSNVRQLNGLLSDLGRPFGHRIYHATAAYAANHPDAHEIGSEDRALVEMMQMRILPKLRGIELQTREDRAVRKIAEFVRDTLDDQSLGQAIQDSIGEDQMFTWKG